MNEKEVVEQLTCMGLTEYQARVYAALTALGPSGVTDINRLSKVPRTKIYETLEELIAKGVVEFQPGRPIVYRATRPALLIKRMTDEYLETAKKAETLLEERYETITEPSQDLVWIVRGDETIRRKLAEIIVSAKGSVFAVESYPPFFLRSIKSLLKAAAKRGLKVRSVCVAEKNELRTEGEPQPELVEFRAFLSSDRKRITERKRSSSEDSQLLDALSKAVSGFYCLTVIDDLESFVIMRNSNDSARSIGLSAKIPGVSILQRIMFERLFVQRTSLYSRR